MNLGIGKMALIVGCLAFVILFLLLGGTIGVGMWAVNNSGSSSSTVASSTPADFNSAAGTETEFQVTAYFPGQGDTSVEGGYGLARGEAIPDSSSPTGLKWSRSASITGIIAVPQHKNAVPIVDLVSDPTKQAKIIIPCYNNNQPAVVADRFGSAGHASNRLDLAMDIGKSHEFFVCIRKYSLGEGIEGSTKVKGKIVGTVIK